MPSEPGFDWGQAASLLGDDPQGVPEDMSDIVKELIQSATASLQNLAAKDPATDAKGISALAHQLRGSVLNFGFTDVGAVLLQIEKVDYTPPQYPGLVKKAQDIFVASTAKLGEHYPSLRLA